MNVLCWDNNESERELILNAFSYQHGLVLRIVATENEFLREMQPGRWHFILLILAGADDSREAVCALDKTPEYRLALKVREAGITIPILFVTASDRIVEVGLDDVQPAFIDTKNAATSWLVIRILQLSRLFQQLEATAAGLRKQDEIDRKRLYLVTILFALYITATAYDLATFHEVLPGPFSSFIFLVTLAVSGALGSSLVAVLHRRGVLPPAVIGGVGGCVLGLSYTIPIYLSRPEFPLSGGTMLVASLVALFSGSALESSLYRVFKRGMGIAEAIQMKDGPRVDVAPIDRWPDPPEKPLKDMR